MEAIENLGPGQVRFLMHAAKDETEVAAGVFALKLSSLVRALEAADKALNGNVRRHDYVIHKLKSSTPTVVLAERATPGVLPPYSGIAGFDECVEAIKLDDRARALRFGSCSKHIAALAKGSERSFSYAEVWTANDIILRVDPLLVEQADAVSGDAADIVQKGTTRWFKGVAFGSFDGSVKEVDLRGSLPQIKLVLTAGGKEIDCIFAADAISEIRRALDQRVRIEGRAIYDGKSGLPRRVEVNSVRLLASDVDFTKWRGSFEPFERQEWVDPYAD